MLRMDSLPKIGTAVLWGFTAICFLVPAQQSILRPVYLFSAVLLILLTFFFQNKMEFDRWIGELSYPIYLGHILVIESARYFIHIQNPEAMVAIDIIAASVSTMYLLDQVTQKCNMRS